MPSRSIEPAWRIAACLLLALPVAVVHAEPGSQDGPPPQFHPTGLPLDQTGYAGVDGGADNAKISLAHRTLPIPSYVEVTSLATGRTILVEVDRHGPASGDDLVDLSCGAAQQLGLTAIPAAVRVRRVSPPDQERAVLAAGRTAAARLNAPEGLLAALRRKLPPSPPVGSTGDCPLATATKTGETQPARPEPRLPQPAPAALVPPPQVEKPRPSAPSPAHAAQPVKGPGYAVQVVALSNRSKAAAVAHSVGGHVEAAGALFRVRTGPYPSDAAARAALSQIRAKGFADARVVTNEGP